MLRHYCVAVGATPLSPGFEGVAINCLQLAVASHVSVLIKGDKSTAYWSGELWFSRNVYPIKHAEWCCALHDTKIVIFTCWLDVLRASRSYIIY